MKQVVGIFLSIIFAFGIAFAQGEKLNINIASQQALSHLSGIGPKTAKKIIDYRNAHGFFNNVEEIKNVSGIGEKKFEKLKDYITTTGGVVEIKKNTRKKF
ncbi:Late competence protein ComEA, DNA receptor [Desulfurella amilsii]|uniref:Late competence protein ComEA, DNA receptor n=1 Tax=Desulfurella amilsii TaxID=1562698 RepID=A0A1X4XXP4_9BACT|nr:helix-hairpin-helix domain-containing protein [Desulfurella amilsii]OSS42311.1 Late competence protein ComEA, DNA receptor [Desulfurella amilsii]